MLSMLPLHLAVVLVAFSNICSNPNFIRKFHIISFFAPLPLKTHKCFIEICSSLKSMFTRTTPIKQREFGIRVSK